MGDTAHGAPQGLAFLSCAVSSLLCFHVWGRFSGPRCVLTPGAVVRARSPSCSRVSVFRDGTAHEYFQARCYVGASGDCSPQGQFTPHAALPETGYEDAHWPVTFLMSHLDAFFKKQFCPRPGPLLRVGAGFARAWARRADGSSRFSENSASSPGLSPCSRPPAHLSGSVRRSHTCLEQ